MAGVKISALPAVVTPALTDIFPIVQGGVTYKETGTQLLSLFNSNIQISESQVTNLVTDLAAKLNLSGGTMTGTLLLNTSTPTTALEAASKGYVDTIAQGITVQGACYAASTTALTVTYNNGIAGVGATLTNATTQATFSIDGVTPALNSRILIKDQADNTQNGIYVVSNAGSGATNWVLTRATDYDQPTEINAGDLVIINNGTVNANSSWLQTANVTLIGTSPITFSVFFSPSNYLSSTLTSAHIYVGNVSNIGTNVAVSGDLTLANTGAFTIANSAVTNAKLANMADQTIKGNVSGGAAAPVDLTKAQVLTMLSSPINQINVQVFTATGTYTPTTGMKYCIIECQGAGGGGGGAAATGNCSGGGGGSGGYIAVLNTAADIGASKAVTIGAGGTAGAAGNNAGGTGGASSVGALFSCNGGGGGSGNAGSATPTFGVGGGTGGSVSLTTGTYLKVIGGGAGFDGYNGGATIVGWSPSGANSPFGNGGVVATSAASTGVDAPANSGAGGSGGFGTSGSKAGGVGGSGYAVVTEYISV